MNALVRADFNEVHSIAKAMAGSGYFSDANDASKAIVKILAGQELGLGPFAAMTGIHIIKGKAVMGANLIATLIKSDPRYDYRVVQLDDKGCQIEFYEHGERIGVSTFGPDDAKAAGLGGDNWRKFPRNMYFARAISNGAKWFTPGIFGGSPVYTAEELGADFDDDGDVLIVEMAPEHQSRHQPPVDDEPEDIPPPPSNGNGGDEMLKTKRREFHAVGTELYGDAWDDKRPELTAAISNGAHTSSNDLTYSQLDKLVRGMRERLNTVPA